MIKLPTPGPTRDRMREVEWQRQIEAADKLNHKKNQDVEVGDARLLLTADNGDRYEVTVNDAGFLQVVAINGALVNSNDAFGRLRVSDPLTLFDSQLQYNEADLLYETVTTGTGATSHNPSESSVTLTVASGGDSALRQSKQYIRYKPGKSQYILLTGVFGATPTGDLVRKIGYYDSDNGLFLQQDSSGLSWVRRTKTSGSVVEEVVAQADWSESSFDSIDPSKTFLMFIDMEWLGVGQARVGFFQDGAPKTAHIFNAVPDGDVPYIATANLPVRYEISSAASETGTMKQICSAVISEGGFEDELGIPQSRDNGGSPTSISTSETPVIAIRPKTTFNSITNRGTIVPESIEVFSDTAAYYRVYHNASVTTAASWTSQSANSIAEYDISGTAFSSAGAELVASGFIAASNATKAGSADESLTVRLPLTLDVSGANPTEFVITMTAISGTGDGYAALRWRELY